MSHPDVLTDPAGMRCLDDAAPDDPFTALRFHFGMLLGVDDFETEQAYHRGQARLHQSWLHGAGVVWGLAVGLDLDDSEVRVEPGLATDGAGRALHLDAAACVDPGQWLDQHADEVELDDHPPEGADAAFDAHVEARWASCLTRPVPALAEPCENAAVETAFSRVWETIELRLVPGLADPPPVRYRRVRILLGLLAPGEADGDADAAQARADVLATADTDRAAAALAAFRHLANLDAIELAPPVDGDGTRVLTAEAPPAPVVLANLRGVALRGSAEAGWELVGGDVELTPRRSHVATETVQELVVAALAGDATPGSGSGLGPRVVAVEPGDQELRIRFSERLDERSVKAGGFDVMNLTSDGWIAATGDDPPKLAEALDEVTIPLEDALAPPWRVVVHGAGSEPLMSTNLEPLNGGHDHVHLERS